MTYFISAPFGNYLQHTNFISGATCVTGTFTLKPRRGLLKQVLKTLRYVPTEAGWTWRNQLGLRNPGIFKGIEKHPITGDIIRFGRGKYIEAGFTGTDAQKPTIGELTLERA